MAVGHVRQVGQVGQQLVGVSGKLYRQQQTGGARGNKQDRHLSERADVHAAVRPGGDEATGGNVLLFEARQKDFSASGAVVIMDKINKSVSGFGKIGVRNIFSAVDQHSAIP